MDCFSDPRVEQITGMTSAQISKTTIIENVTGYYCHYDPCPMLLVQPRLEDAEEFSKDRLSTMFRDTEVLSEVFGKTKTRDGNNTLLHKKFPGGFIKLGGANSPAGLASKPIRILLLDEVDRYPFSAKEEGDPVNLAVKRTNNFHNRKIGAFSTPTRKKMSRIEALFENSDKRRYHVKCPNCGEWITFIFWQLKWDKGNPSSAVYTCQKCEAIIDEALKPKLLLEGKWIAEKEFNGHAGFHLNELYSPWRKWSQIAKEFLESKDNPLKLKTFYNTSLGETFEEKGEAPEWRRLYERRENYPTNKVPMRGLLITGSADIQKDRIEVEIKAWGRNKENWSIDHRVLMGDTTLDPVWNQLSEVINEQFEHESGMKLPIRLFAVDSGYNTQRVYDFVRQYPANRVVAIKGAGNQQIMVSTPKAVDLTSAGKTIKRGLKVWSLGTDLMKSELYGLLKMEFPTETELLETNGRFPPGFCHFPQYGEEYFKQLTAESLVSKTSKGYIRYEWTKQYERNEALDLHIYNRAASVIVGIDRFKEHHWLELEALIPKFENLQEEKIETPPKASTPVQTGRTQLKKSTKSWL